GAVLYDVAGSDVDFTTQRGWVIDLSIITGLRSITRSLPIGKTLALVSTVAPAQNIVACDASTGVGITFVLPVLTGENPTYRLFDTNGDNVVDSSDSTSVGFYTTSPGGEKVYLPGSDRGSGGGDGGSFCPPGFKLGAVLDTTSGNRLCEPEDPVPPQAIKDRVWRRIINPPIR
ncbi:MAG: hypothetical protein Q8S16_02975, partial [Polaromonas sp.]|nr:hypothetical protein [Polaromonas sp.]